MFVDCIDDFNFNVSRSCDVVNSVLLQFFFSKTIPNSNSNIQTFLNTIFIFNCVFLSFFNNSTHLMANTLFNTCSVFLFYCTLTEIISTFTKLNLVLSNGCR